MIAATSMPRRRWLQAALVAGGFFVASPGLLLARTPGERRFVFIIQRGAADGLNTVIPYADPAYAALRGPLALDGAKGLRLDGQFALHPALEETGRMYQAGQALFVHAVALSYRDRSHFDAQNVLETGGAAPYQRKDGWMNRLLALLPQPDREAIALASTVPMALRGAQEVTSYAPSGLPTAGDDLLLRVQQLYERDAMLHPLWTAALEARNMAAASMNARARQDPAAALGKRAASFLVQPHGPRVAMLESGGWDTHSAQNARLSARLKALDTTLGALRDGLGEAWAHTVVLVATEFGRTAAANGTNGTDHGTGSVAWLAGGAVQGGRVLADWPGLARNDLYEGRDLRPTLALESVIAAAAGECFGFEPQRVQRSVFGQEPAAGRTVPQLLRS